MTDQPKTIRLDPYEWRVLIATGLAQVHNDVASVAGPAQVRDAVPTLAQVQALNEALDRLRLQIGAWYSSAEHHEQIGSHIIHRAVPDPDLPFDPDPPDPTPHIIHSASGGVAPPSPPEMKRSRGWPKGKKRGPRRANAGAVQ